MSEKGPTLDGDPSLSSKREQRSEGRLILASVRNLNALATEESRIDWTRAQAMRGPHRSRPAPPEDPTPHESAAATKR